MARIAQDFADKVALVTGAGGGIGRAAAELFARGGARVAVVDINAEIGRNTVERIHSAGGEAEFFQVDVAREAEIEAMIHNVIQRFGGLHCAFNNAGISGTPGPFHEMSLDEWNRVITINLTAVFLCMKHEIRHMIGAGGGAIVNTSSGAGMIPAPYLPHYTAAKHGVLGLGKVAAREYARQNIRINAICPGVTDTPMMQGTLAMRPDLEEPMLASVPFGRMGRPEEVAAAAVWLCSDAASFVSGEAMLVDGASVCR
ncbi:MAG: glucose 1-dehydrogenase [Proteobacteria bacterium]|nr:glucose 1-dehydrogenase [Pseudomonadota bacterium]HQR02972.1 glucose 1-dehydrogenase [Rhodocyclaceae bacterium]